MVDFRNAIFLLCAFIFILPGILLLVLDEQVLGSRNPNDLVGTASGLLAVGIFCLLALAVNWGGVINRDEKELFGEQPSNALSN